jgi:hypothetical protein
VRLRNAYTSGAVPPLRDGLDPLFFQVLRGFVRHRDRKPAGPKLRKVSGVRRHSSKS